MAAIIPPSIGSPIASSTSGSVLFADVNSNFAQDNANLFWDATNHRLGIGTSAFGTNNKLLVNPYNTVDNLATAQISTTVATNKGLVVQGFTSQSAKLFEAQNSAGTPLMAIAADGTICLRNITPSPWNTALFQAIEAVNTSLLFGVSTDINFNSNAYYDATNNWKYKTTAVAANYLIYSGTHYFRIAQSGTADSVINWMTTLQADINGFMVQPALAANKGLIVKGLSSQSANLFEAQNSSGSTVAAVTAAGYIGVGTGTPATWGAFAVRTSIVVNTKNVSASYSDGVNSTFDIRHLTGSVVDLSSENSNLTFSTTTAGTDGVERMRITPAGSVLIGTAALATTATDGFLYIDSGAGTPTGVPTAQTGRIPIYYDSTNNFLYVYNGGSWKKTTVFA